MVELPVAGPAQQGSATGISNARILICRRSHHLVEAAFISLVLSEVPSLTKIGTWLSGT